MDTTEERRIALSNEEVRKVIEDHSKATSWGWLEDRYVATFQRLMGELDRAEAVVEAAEELSGLWHHLPNDHSETVAAMQRLDARLDAWHTGGGE